MYSTLENVDALLICTEWSIFRTLNYQKLKDLMKSPVIFDGRNLYDVNEMNSEGIKYVSIGRKVVEI